MARFGIRVSGGRYFVLQPDGTELFVHEAGRPIAPLLPGWSATGVIGNLAPLFLLDLLHEDGARATWVLDETMQRIALSVRELGGPMRTLLQERAASLMQSMLASILSAPVPDDVDALHDIELVDDPTMHQIVDLAMDSVLRGLTTVDVSTATGTVAGLDRADLARTLEGSIPQDYRDLMATGEMRCALPDGNGEAVAQLGMILLDRLTAYRFVSPSLGAFYVLTRDYHQNRNAVFIPSLSLYAHAGDAPDARMAIAVMLCHAVRQHHRLARCLAGPARRRKPLNFVSDFPKIHIGHVIWNELAGLEELAAMLPHDALPDVMVINSEIGSEPYGRIDVLFPEYAGRVRRPDITWQDAAAYVYDEDVFFVRYMTRFVRRSVGQRILDQLPGDARLDGDRQLARRIGPARQPCILLGLRVGNRTLRDQVAFLTAAIDHLIKRLGRITVVLEGTNSRLGFDPSTTFGGFKLPGSEEPVIEELRTVFAIRQRFENRPVDIVSTAGCPLVSSIFWIQQCRFFVAPWGAALLKYRWVCNLPGFVVTNRHNIGQPVSDLPIYHDEEFNEAPAPMMFVPLEHIQDAPGPAGFYANFDITPDALCDGIDALIALTG